MSPDALARREETRRQLAEENAAHEPEFYLQVNEAQVQDIAAGYVPMAVQAMARFLLDLEDQDRRRAARPVKKATRKPTAAVKA